MPDGSFHNWKATRLAKSAEASGISIKSTDGPLGGPFEAPKEGGELRPRRIDNRLFDVI